MIEPRRRVVVTGVGAVSAAGMDAEAMFASVIGGQSGMRRIAHFDTSDFPVGIAAEIPEATCPEVDRYREWGRVASAMAMRDARLDGWPDGARSGTIAGTALGNIAAVEREIAAGSVPSPIGRWFGASLAQEISSGLGEKGTTLMVNSSFASGADAIGIAAKRIRDGSLDVAVAGGSEAPITPSIIAGFTSLGALADDADDPTGAIRPFDMNRRGCGLGEGAAFLVLEERHRAIARGATILAELIGYGAAMDAFHITQLPEDGNGLRRAMQLALEDANVRPGDVDYINAHGTGTDMNDRIESAVIREVFGAHADRIPVSSTKPITGHLLGAAGSLEAVVTILAMQANIAPPTINWSTRDPECGLDYIPNVARPVDIAIAMTNSMGFGGHSSSLIFRKGGG